MTVAPSSGHLGPRTARDAFQLYLLSGLNPLPGRPGTKEVALDGSGVYRRRARAEYLDEWFPNGEPRNIGVVNGELSSNLADVDLDSAEAVRLAPGLLPVTAWRFGRERAADSLHLEYTTDAPFPHATRKYTDPVLPADDAKATLLELRGSGHWSVWPPSVHPTGLPIVWRSLDDRGPARVRLAELERVVGRLAAAALLARHWPVPGRRDDAALALTGALIRAGWAADDVEQFVESVALAATDDEPAMRTNGKAGRAQAKLEAGGNVWGWPKLSELLGACGGKVVAETRRWLGLTTATDGAAPRPGGVGSSPYRRTRPSRPKRCRRCCVSTSRRRPRRSAATPPSWRCRR